MSNSEAKTSATTLGKRLLEAGYTITTAESCTGGGISAAITAIAGSSTWFHQAFVTYSNGAKTQMLGVDKKVLDSHGAVSEEVVCAMLKGALARASADLGVAVSGIAGPGGEVEGKPVGTVWFAWGGLTRLKSKRFHFSGDRDQVRDQAVLTALSLACDWMLELDSAS